MTAKADIHLDAEQAQALRERLAHDRLSAADRSLLITLLDHLLSLLATIKEAKISIHRLKVMLFGKGAKKAKKPRNTASGKDDNAPKQTPPEHPAQALESGSTQNSPKKGHGRTPASAYTPTTTVVCENDHAPGERCPQCQRGTLYRLRPMIDIQIEGQAPLSATQYQRNRLRCSACQAIITPALPPGVEQGKYTSRANATTAVLHYGLGMPFYRLEKLQAMVGVPVADATQWEMAERVADCAYPAFNALVHQAAQGDIIYHDDTSVKILSLLKENQTLADEARRGMFTTGIVSGGEQTIVLYFSGRQHAGENIDELLGQRAQAHAPVIKMSDALSSNRPKTNQNYIQCYCNSHALRQFSDIEAFFPQQCEVVLKLFSQLYENEATIGQQNLNAEQRLIYHQKHSGPLMETLQAWIKAQFEQRLIEPNSSLGRACSYLQTHWESLTRFLHLPGVPLDNNTVERALKGIILLRKASLFFKNEHGAYVGSLLSSLIATCAQANINPIDYFVALQRHRSAVFAAPNQWLPWNYQHSVDRLASAA